MIIQSLNCRGDMLQKRNIKLSFLIGIIFSVAALLISFRSLPLAQLLDHIRSIPVWWIFLSTLTGLSAYLVRALRWKIILNPVRKIGFWHAFHPVMIAFTINCILPGRLGELARPAILHKQDKVEFSKVLATVVVERAFDILTLLCLFIFIMSSISIDQSLTLTFNGHEINQATLLNIRSKTVLAGFILTAFILMFMFPATRWAMSRFISRLARLPFLAAHHAPRGMSDRWNARIHAVLDNFALGFEVLRNPMTTVLCILLSISVWLLNFISFYLLVLGCPGVSLSFIQTAAWVIFICFFIMLPSVPGYWGIWEIGGIYGLMIFGVPKTEAAGLTLISHFIQIVPLILVGLLSSWITGVNMVQTGLRAEKGNREGSSRENGWSGSREA